MVFIKFFQTAQSGTLINIKIYKYCGLNAILGQFPKSRKYDILK